jgi:hypothetical protein
MNSVEMLVDSLTKAYVNEGKTEEQSRDLTLEYLKAMLERLALTDPSIDKQVKRRIETIRKVTKNL